MTRALLAIYVLLAIQTAATAVQGAAHNNDCDANDASSCIAADADQGDAVRGSAFVQKKVQTTKEDGNEADEEADGEADGETNDNGAGKDGGESDDEDETQLADTDDHTNDINQEFTFDIAKDAKHLKQIFDDADQDKSGDLTPVELAEGDMAKTDADGAEVLHEQIKLLCDAYDKDDTGTLSWSEFQAAYKSAAKEGARGFGGADLVEVEGKLVKRTGWGRRRRNTRRRRSAPRRRDIRRRRSPPEPPACHDECKHSTCTWGNTANGGKPMWQHGTLWWKEYVCHDRCSKPYSGTRYCGLSGSYASYDSINCAGCLKEWAKSPMNSR